MSRFSSGRQLPVGELRHVLRSGEHRVVDLLLGGRLQRRRELAGGQRAALTGEVVAGRAVEPEQLAAAGEIGTSISDSCAISPLASRTTVGPPPLAWM